MYITFTNKNKEGGYGSSPELKKAFYELLKVEDDENDYYDDYQKKLKKELDKFNNFNKEDGIETASEATTATKKRSTLFHDSSKSPKSRVSGISPSRIEDREIFADDTINVRDQDFDADYDDALD